MIQKIRVGPSLKRRTAPTYKNELTFGIVMSTFNGLVSALIPLLVEYRNKGEED